MSFVYACVSVCASAFMLFYPLPMRMQRAFVTSHLVSEVNGKGKGSGNKMRLIILPESCAVHLVTPSQTVLHISERRS